MTAQHWYKRSTDFWLDPKIATVSLESGVVFGDGLLALHTKNDRDGVLTAAEASPELIRIQLGNRIGKAKIRRCLAQLENAGLIAIKDTGDVVILGWGDDWRPPKSSASRMRAMRKRQKGDARVTSPSVTGVTERVTERVTECDAPEKRREEYPPTPLVGCDADRVTPGADAGPTERREDSAFGGGRSAPDSDPEGGTTRRASTADAETERILAGLAQHPGICALRSASTRWARARAWTDHGRRPGELYDLLDEANARGGDPAALLMHWILEPGQAADVLLDIEGRAKHEGLAKKHRAAAAAADSIETELAGGVFGEDTKRAGEADGGG